MVSLLSYLLFFVKRASPIKAKFMCSLLLNGRQKFYYSPNFEKVGSILDSPCAYVRRSVRKYFKAMLLKFHIMDSSLNQNTNGPVNAHLISGPRLSI